ncbi:MAG: biotin transporter BioY [Euryarchaeota archaeon]|nr:biotin transporter BioY [Euryarchaeota archaeon]
MAQRGSFVNVEAHTLRNAMYRTYEHKNTIVSIFLLTTLIAVGAKIRIYTPLTPVPFTLQTLFVGYTGLHLRKYRFAPPLIYVVLGFLGVPVFAGNGGGLAYLSSPTLGYLIGFIIAPVIIGLIYRENSYTRAVISTLIGLMVILIAGSLYLGLIYGNILKGFCLGALPFIPFELIKAMSAGTMKTAELYIRK